MLCGNFYDSEDPQGFRVPAVSSGFHFFYFIFSPGLGGGAHESAWKKANRFYILLYYILARARAIPR
jgi:hypothetical protein